MTEPPPPDAPPEVAAVAGDLGHLLRVEEVASRLAGTVTATASVVAGAALLAVSNPALFLWLAAFCVDLLILVGLVLVWDKRPRTRAYTYARGLVVVVPRRLLDRPASVAAYRWSELRSSRLAGTDQVELCRADGVRVVRYSGPAAGSYAAVLAGSAGTDVGLDAGL
jgi:hypothetical protein